MKDIPIPGPLKALINAVRGNAGLEPQQTPGPATTAAGNFRDENFRRAEQGLPPLSPEEYIRALQQPVSTPR